MSSAPAINLTPEDIIDLAAGHTINAMDDAGNEHDMVLDRADISAIQQGETLDFNGHPLYYR